MWSVCGAEEEEEEERCSAGCLCSLLHPWALLHSGAAFLSSASLTPSVHLLSLLISGAAFSHLRSHTPLLAAPLTVVKYFLPLEG